jgi:F0F1-type ATP synthase alpha subunit
MSGMQAERINTTGRYVENKTTFVDIVGRQRTIGSGKYIKGTGTKGSADISATIFGRSIKIEIKYGKDIQSQAQKEYQQSIEQAGGIYIIVRDFDSFLEWFNKFKNQVK